MYLFSGNKANMPCNRHACNKTIYKNGPYLKNRLGTTQKQIKWKCESLDYKARALTLSSTPGSITWPGFIPSSNSDYLSIHLARVYIYMSLKVQHHENHLTLSNNLDEAVVLIFKKENGVFIFIKIVLPAFQ